MAGIYIHIPFCKQACHYCNFHFATSLHYKNELVGALLKEIDLTLPTSLSGGEGGVDSESIETVYFGGGTPSLLTNDEILLILNKIRNKFKVVDDAEITFEVNPDDITEEKLLQWKNEGINRLSIGIQSFFDEDLKWMNRAHSAKQALDNLQLAKTHFENISIDLIYGTPALTNEKWKQNVDRALALNIPHLSCYALTVEANTPLYKMISQKQSPAIDADKQSEQFMLLMQWLSDAGFEHYEISNFAKPGWRSKHNSSYWQAKNYIGLGPSAHSFNGNTRQWNISNNNKYIESINNGIIPFEKEELSVVQKSNEYIMISLRTIEGINIDKMEESHKKNILHNSERFINSGLMKRMDNYLVLTNEGKLMADGIASALFI